MEGKNIFMRLREFIEGRGLICEISYGTSCASIRVSNSDNIMHVYRISTYDLENKTTDYLYGTIADEILRDFAIVETGEKVLEDAGVGVVCGLTKHEYMALELTKAWASTTGQRYYDEEDIVKRYEDMLQKLKERNL